MNGSADFEAGKHLGEIFSQLQALGKSVDEIKISMARYGERTGALEDKQRDNITAMKVMEAQMSPVLKDIEDLKDTRKKVSWALVGSYGAAILAKLWK